MGLVSEALKLGVLPASAFAAEAIVPFWSDPKTLAIAASVSTAIGGGMACLGAQCLKKRGIVNRDPSIDRMLGSAGSLLSMYFAMVVFASRSNSPPIGKIFFEHLGLVAGFQIPGYPIAQLIGSKIERAVGCHPNQEKKPILPCQSVASYTPVNGEPEGNLPIDVARG